MILLIFISFWYFTLLDLFSTPKFPYEAEWSSKKAHLWDNLLLDQVDAHRHDGHAQQKVDGPKHDLGIRLPLRHRGVGHVVDVRVPGHKVAKADGHETSEAKVGPIQDAPALPGGEDDSAAEDVGDKDKEAGGDSRGE